MRFLFTMILTLVFSMSTAFAGTQAAVNAAEFDLNRASPGAMQKYQLGTIVMKHELRMIKAVYDFAVNGGAVSTITLKGDNGQSVVIPKGAIVVDCLIDTITPATTSASGTIAFGTGQATNDLKAALAAASLTGLVACVPVGSAATSIKMTADRTMTATIATGALTAGKAYVYVYYIMSSTT